MENENRSATNNPPNSGASDRPTHSPDGVDLTLIRWMLSLSLDERLEVLQQHINAVLALRDANPHL